MGRQVAAGVARNVAAGQGEGAVAVETVLSGVADGEAVEIASGVNMEGSAEEGEGARAVRADVDVGVVQGPRGIVGVGRDEWERGYNIGDVDRAVGGENGDEEGAAIGDGRK